MRHLNQGPKRQARGDRNFFNSRSNRRLGVQYFRLKEGRKRRLGLFILVLLVIGVLIVISAIFVPQATIRAVEVVLPPERVSDASAIEAAAREFLAESKFRLPRGHVLSFSQGALESRLRERFDFPAIKIKRESPMKIIIEPVIPYPVFSLTANNKEPILLDQMGSKIEGRIDQDETLIKIENSESYSFIPAWLATRILQLSEALAAMDLKNERFRLVEGFQGPLYIYLKAGWYLIVDNEASLESLVDRLRILTSNEFLKRRPSEYVDLRFGERVIYK